MGTGNRGGDGGGAAAHLANGHDLLDLFFDGIVILLLRGLLFAVKGLSGSKPLAKNIIDEVVACEHGRSNAVSSPPAPVPQSSPTMSAPPSERHGRPLRFRRRPRKGHGRARCGVNNTHTRKRTYRRWGFASPRHWGCPGRETCARCRPRRAALCCPPSRRHTPWRAARATAARNRCPRKRLPRRAALSPTARANTRRSLPLLVHPLRGPTNPSRLSRPCRGRARRSTELPRASAPSALACHQWMPIAAVAVRGMASNVMTKHGARWRPNLSQRAHVLCLLVGAPVSL